MVSQRHGSSGTRPYRLQKRAEGVGRTRLAITEAAVRLHTTRGPAKTTMSAVANEAGVSRVTLYRHFPDEAALFAACSLHWALLHPPPDETTWKEHSPIEPRARVALGDLYGWYRDNADSLFLFRRDAHALPPEVRERTRAAATRYADALTAGSGIKGAARHRLRAAAGHVVSYVTWRSLAVDQGVGDGAVELAVLFLLSAARDTRVG
jgi:AcrR family transcriptional regulator